MLVEPGRWGLRDSPGQFTSQFRRKVTVRILAGFMLMGLSAFGAAIGTGSFAGPDDSFAINLTLGNSGVSTTNVTSITLNGNTAASFPILWDYAGSPSIGGTTISGEDTRILTISGLNLAPGASFQLLSMDPDGDPSPAGVEVGQLIGVTATFTFADQSTWEGVFVDDPARGAGIVLEPSQVPEPSTYAMMLCGAAALLVRRRMGQKA